MERTVENVRRIRNTVSNIFYLLIGGVGLGGIINILTDGLSHGIPLGEAVIGIGTLILAFATFYLAFSEMEEGIRNREQEEAEAITNRRRLRVKEQLDGFYAPVYGIGRRDFIELGYHRTADHYVHKMMKELRSKYGYLASDELREDLDHYYTLNLPQLRPQEWLAIIEPLWDRIMGDYESLVDEYNAITIPE